MTSTEISLDRSTRESIEQFIFHELRLLDDHEYPAWVELFAADGVYWVPSNLDDYDPKKHVSIIYDDKPALLLRIARLAIGRAVQQIRSRVVHQSTNLLVLDETDEEITVRVAMVVFEVQRDRKNYYPGHCLYRLRRTATGFEIVLKKLCLIDNDQYYEHLAFMV
jgi:3-phenylpropionate/cinnamic acid dioxygenase small subunit